MPTKKVRILSVAIAGGLVFTGVTAAAITPGHAPARAALAANTASPPPANLDNCPMLSEGYQDVGCVIQLQTELNTIVGLNLSVDGTFGSTTKTAVERFQQEHNIVPADGIVGPQTKAALDNPGSSSAGTPPGQLNPGQRITSGTQIASPDGKFVLQMQGDGNLVLRAPGNIPLGDTRTAGHDGTIAVMQADGNFVLRAPGNLPVWASGTDGHPGTVLQVQDDGNVVLYAPGHQALRVLFPASPDPQNNGPTPAVSPATAPATGPGTSDGSGGANTAPANTAPGTTSGSNSGHIGPGYTGTPGGVRCVQGAVGVIMDGHYGQATYTAVKQFQASHGLTVDGIVGPATGDVIIAALPDAVRFDCARVVPTTVYIMDDHGNIATGGTAYNKGPNGDPGAAIDNGKPLGTCLANGIKNALEGPGRLIKIVWQRRLPTPKEWTKAPNPWLFSGGLIYCYVVG